MYYRVLVVLNENDGDEDYFPTKEEIDFMLAEDLACFSGLEFDYFSLYEEENAEKIFGIPITKEYYPVQMDVLTKEILKECYAIVDGGCWFKRERYEPWHKKNRMVPQELPPLSYLKKKHPKGLVVLIDVHN
jgi:hypothetical protein